ncbi:MAG: hypothetical protein H6828_05735 [Planctomycetes bacterium]|nr:hypothetical protein [Planctomycetota bacterium]
MGFDLDPSTLLAGLVVSSVGMGLFLYGKRQARPPQLVAGLSLLVFPGFLHGAGWVFALGGLVLGALWGALRAGF